MKLLWRPVLVLAVLLLCGMANAKKKKKFIPPEYDGDSPKRVIKREGFSIVIQKPPKEGETPPAKDEAKEKPPPAAMLLPESKLVLAQKPEICISFAEFGDFVTFKYTAHLGSADGAEIDSSGARPLRMKLQGNVGGGLGLRGMCAGERRHVSVPANAQPAGVAGLLSSLSSKDDVLVVIEMVDVEKSKLTFASADRDQKVELYFDTWDSDNDGLISKKEYLSNVVPKSELPQDVNMVRGLRESLRRSFAKEDVNTDGFISPAEFATRRIKRDEL